MKSKYLLDEKSIVQLIPTDGGCIATNHITIDGLEVGYMYRESTERNGDTGWRFFSGDESEEYLNDIANSNVWSINTVANYDPSILDYLNTPAPCSFEKIEGSRYFQEI